jgi:hypothetical protein
MVEMSFLSELIFSLVAYTAPHFFFFLLFLYIGLGKAVSSRDDQFKYNIRKPTPPTFVETDSHHTSIKLAMNGESKIEEAISCMFVIRTLYRSSSRNS